MASVVIVVHGVLTVLSQAEVSPIPDAITLTTLAPTVAPNTLANKALATSSISVDAKTNSVGAARQAWSIQATPPTSSSSHERTGPLMAIGAVLAVGGVLLTRTRKKVMPKTAAAQSLTR